MIKFGIDLWQSMIDGDDDPAFWLRAQRQINPDIGTLNSFTCASGYSTIDYLNRQLVGLPGMPLLRNARTEINLFADTSNWSVAHASSESLSDWSTANGATIDSATTFTIDGQAGSHIKTYQYTPTGKFAGQVFGWLVKLSGTAGEQLRIVIAEASNSYPESLQTVTLTADAQWYYVERTLTDNANTNVTFRIREADGASSAVTATFHGAMPILMNGDSSAVPPEYVSYGVGVGPNLVPSATFDNWTDSSVPDGWTKSGTHNVNNYVQEGASGGLRLVSDGTLISIKISGVITQGSQYYIRYKYSDKTSGSLSLNIGGTTAVPLSANVNVDTELLITADIDDSEQIVIKRTVGAVDCTLEYLYILNASHGLLLSGVKAFNTDKSHISVTNGLVDYSGTKTVLTGPIGLQKIIALTDYCDYAYQFDATTAAWTLTNATITDNASTNLRGLPEMDLLIEDSSLGVMHRAKRTISISASTTYCITAVVKNHETNGKIYIKLRANFDGTAGPDSSVVFNFSTEALSSNTFTGGSGVVSLGNGFYLIWGIETGVADTITVTSHLHLMSDAGATTYDGDGVSGCYISSIHVFDPPIPALPLYGSNSTSTQDATLAKYDWPANLTNNFVLEMDVVLDGIDEGKRFFCLYKNATNYFRLNYPVGGGIKAWFVLAGTAPVATAAIGTLALDTNYNIKVRKSATNGLDIWVNGSKGTGNNGTTAKTALFDMTGVLIELMSENDITQAYGGIRNFRIHVGDYTDAQVVAL